MRRDLLIGFLVAVLIHLGLAFGDRLWAKPAPPAAAEDIPTLTITLPPVEPDVLPTDSTESAPAGPTDLAPPTQPDVPAIQLDNPFLQPLQPTPPPGLTRPAALITIPVGRPGGSGRGQEELFSLDQLDEPPEAIVKVSPVYPYEMHRAGITGEVVVIFTIDPAGNVRDAEIFSSTQRDFEAPALQAMAQWKFKPGKIGGRAVNTRRRQPIEFTLNGEP